MEIKKYSFAEVLENLEYGQMAILVEGYAEKPYSGVGDSMYFDEHDFGILKFVKTGNEVMVCKGNKDTINNKYIIVDRGVV